MTATAVPVAAPHAGPPAPISPEQMLRLHDDGRLYELVDGKLVEKQMSDFAQLVANLLNDELALWAKHTGSGRSFVEATYRCFPHAPAMVRRPDVSFIAHSRLAAYQWGQGHLTIAPDLAVEVVSPNDEVLELDRKINDYFRAGVRRVWVINPEQQTLRVHRAPGDLSELIGDADVSDDQLLPGFRCPLPGLFVRPARQ
jgi:Uma2 family endonuclease